MTNWETVQSQIEILFDSLTDIEVSAYGQLFEYQGFNPESIASALVRCEENAADRSRDIHLIIVLFLCRGNKFAKIIKKSAPDAIRMLQTLQNKYRIKSGRPASNNDITLARVVATFPHTAFQITVKMNPQRPMEQWLMSKGIGNIPTALKAPGISSLLSRNMSKNERTLKLLKTLAICHHAEAEVINMQRDAYKRSSIEEKFYQILQYGRAAFSNTHVNASQRDYATGIMISGNLSPFVALYGITFGATNDEVIATEFTYDGE